MVKKVDVYLVSSTLHFFWAFMLASRNKESSESHLILIDQYKDRPLVMMNYLTGTISPFCSKITLEGRELGGWNKLKNRQNQFKWVNEFIALKYIDRVFIGNDRSVLGQFFIKQTKALNPETIGCYLDDGVFTYLGRSASQKKSERYVDAFFKKVIYGFWYDTPQTVGASKWIDQAWVMYPEEVNESLKSKKCVDLPVDQNGLNALLPFSTAVLGAVAIQYDELQTIDVLITLPNETLFSKIPGYGKAMQKLITEILKKNLKVAIKYHPAAGDCDPLDLEGLGVIRLNSQVGFELMIPYLKECTLIGDLSTTILIAQYSGQLSVMMIKPSNSEYAIGMTRLCERIGVETYGMDNLNSLLQRIT